MSLKIINYIVTAAIIIGIGICLKKFIKYNKEKPEEETNLPNIAATLGMMGTFIGICLGLATFNTTDIESSIPSLLSGMKTAFITSIAGMMASIIMKVIQEKKNLSKQEETMNYEDDTEVVKAIINELKTLNSTLTTNQQQLVDRFKIIDENSNKKQEDILKEIKLFNTGVNVKQEELIKEFKSFAETMVEQNSKSLIEALNDVIKDFNNKITEQFGENFKQLNEAVGALLIWQENYKEHIEVSEKQLKTTIEAITKTEESTKTIADKASILISVSEKLEPILINMDNNQKNMQINMETLSKITSDAKQAIPSINDYFQETNKSINILLKKTNETMEENMNIVQQHLRDLNNNTNMTLDTVFNQIQNKFNTSTSIIEGYTENYLENFNQVVEELKTVVPDINTNIVDASNKFKLTLSTFKEEISETLDFNTKSMQAQVQTLENATNSITGNLDNAFSNMSSNIVNVNEDISEQIRNMIENSEEIFKNKVDQLHKTLEVELNNSLKTLGTQLVQISNRFAQDYIPLADKLKQVVSIAEGVN